MPGPPSVLCAVSGGVATISLNRPARHNALDNAMFALLDDTWAAVMADPAARVVLLRGQGQSFCSGRDTGEIGVRAAGESDLSFIRGHQRLREAQLSSPKPVVAALRGVALGAGLELALGADVRIAADDTRLGFPEIGFGLVTDTGGAPLTTMLAGPSRAKWLLMTGRPIDAGTALAWGLLDQVVGPDLLDETAAAFAAELAGRSPDALALIKQTVDDAWRGPVARGLHAELVAQSLLFAGQDRAPREP